MPDRRNHRGPHPDDESLFARNEWPVLRGAVADYGWLLSHGYAHGSSLKLVGDRYGLVSRQRTAVGRCTCSDADRASRQERRVGAEALIGRPLWLDGYNVLTTIEAALAGGVILPGCDGAYRDMASMHGSFRKVEETRPAIELIAKVTASLRVEESVWYLDRPVSNSGRLKTILEDLAAEHGRQWRVELVPDPDPVLAEAEHVVATADSAILDRCKAWFNLAREVVDREIPSARIVDL